MDVWNREDFTQFGTDGLRTKFEFSSISIKDINRLQL